MDDDNELQDSSQPEVADSTPTPSATVDAEAKQREAQLFARAKRAEEELKKFKASAGSESLKSTDFDIEEIVNLRTDGYSREEVKYMKDLALGSNRSLNEVSNDPFIQAGIRGLRDKAKTNNDTPAPSFRSSTISNQPAGKTWADMSKEERSANFDSYKMKFKKAVA